MTSKASVAVSLAGTQIADRYDLIRQVGAGASACVYQARDNRYEREVAVKILRPEVASMIGAERFLREIKILAGLQHPNILPLYDSGMVGSLPFFVAPYVGGKSLRDRLTEETALPIEDVLRIIRQVAEALDYAHDHGIVHRDIKPENVLLQADHAVLGDFGIARAIDVAGGDQLTASQLAIGTPAYMSPEQATGESHVGRRSDIYSLGVLAYEMLIGAVPFTGATPWAVQARKLADPVPSLRTVRSTIVPEIEAAIKRALSVTPADRWPSAGEFARALAGAGAVTRVRRAPRCDPSNRSGRDGGRRAFCMAIRIKPYTHCPTSACRRCRIRQHDRRSFARLSWNYSRRLAY